MRCVGDKSFRGFSASIIKSVRSATHRDDVLVVGGEGDAVDAVLVAGELADAAAVLDVPDSDRGEVAALPRHQVAPVLGPGDRDMKISVFQQTQTC